MYITLIGAAITFIVNFSFVPRYGMYACAWATFLCYFSMMVISYFWGQKYFHVPYAVKKIISYLCTMLILFAAQKGICALTHLFAIRFVTATVFMGLFLLLVLNVEKEEMRKMPFIGKYIR
jgi:O-antigen/teichoic acid export membrane protein